MSLLRYIIGQRHFLWGVLCIVISAYISIALLTYNFHDPSFSRASDNVTSNLAGASGAFIADFLIQFICIGSILIVLCIFAWGILFIIDEKVKFLVLRMIMLTLSVLAFSGILSFIPVKSEFISSSYGGYIGKYVGSWIGAYFPMIISILQLSLVFLTTFYLAIGISRRRMILIFRMLSKIFRAFTILLSLIAKLITIIIRKKKGEISDFDHESEISFASNNIEKNIRAPRLKAREKKNNKIDEELYEQTEGYGLPNVDLLQNVSSKREKDPNLENQLQHNKDALIRTLNDFGVRGDLIDVHTGPVVTLYELEPAAGTKSSRVIGLADDIARSMKAVSARIAVIPGRNAIGIELPNKKREMIYLRELLESKEYIEEEFLLPLILGKDIAGRPIVADLAKMPHLLVAGTTGSGKSVSINTMLLSILYSLTPKQCRLILIDPKMLELSIYDDIPHLLTPVVTEPKKAISALKWVVKEMEERYRMMSHLGVRNILGFNAKIAEARKDGIELTRHVQTGFDRETGTPLIEKIPIPMNDLPYIVVIVDEMADLMLVAGKEIETSIQRLSQMARAAGIHIIMATQRPSVDVITGVIKANFPTRISFHVTSRIDSRTILGEQGAEQLLGLGDLLYMSSGSRIVRIHGPYVSDQEVRNVVDYLKSQGRPEYLDNITEEIEEFDPNFEIGPKEGDDLYTQAVALIAKERKASTSFIQRCLRIGYNRAATIIERMEKEGIVGPANHVGKREVLIPQRE